MAFRDPVAYLVIKILDKIQITKTTLQQNIRVRKN